MTTNAPNPAPVPRKRAGRPAATPEQRASWKPSRSIRLDATRWAKLQQLGSAWLEQAIDQAEL